MGIPKSDISFESGASGHRKAFRGFAYTLIDSKEVILFIRSPLNGSLAPCLEN